MVQYMPVNESNVIYYSPCAHWPAAVTRTWNLNILISVFKSESPWHWQVRVS
jgi:hypothetical protein